MMLNTKADLSFTATDSVQLRLELGEVIEGRLSTTIPDYDQIYEDGFIWASDGSGLGRLRANGTEWMPLDTYNASPIEDLFRPIETNGTRSAPADEAVRWTVRVNGEIVNVETVSRKSNILDTAQVENYGVTFRTVQNVFFDLAIPLDEGDVVRVSFDDADFEAVVGTYSPEDTLSEAIHVNLAGYHPDADVKYAYLSSWNGWIVDPDDSEDGGAGVPQDYATGMAFRVVNEATGATVLGGQTALDQPLEDGSNWWLNFQQTDVFRMDLSTLDAPGTYHVVVEGIGRSQSFEVGNTHWQDLFTLSASGFYHQRSGIALEQPYTDWERDRALHPDDGVQVLATTVKITDTSEAYDGSLPKPFEFFQDNTTGEILTDAWGGWHDAGDWDRRTQHLESTRKLLELHDLATDWSEDLTLSIPEQGDAIPDLLDEAIWGAAVFRRLQQEDGGVPGGIESQSYGSFGDTSFNDPRPFYAYAADAWTTWHYAATAAKIARILEPYDATEAAAWLASARAAMDWAEANIPADYDNGWMPAARNLAAVELYKTTGEAAFHDLFVATTVYLEEGVQWFEQQWDSAWAYATATGSGIDTDLQAITRQVLVDRANWMIDEGLGARPGFGFLHDPYAPYGWGSTGQQPNYSADFVLRAHALTGDDRYLNAAIADVDYALGANPLNTAFLTGIDGVRSPEEILNADADGLGLAPPPGITLYGDFNIYDYGWDFYHSQMYDYVWPGYYQAPVAESYQGHFAFVPSTEYTVMQGIQDMTFVTGYLAAQSPVGNQSINGTDGSDTLDGGPGNDTLRGFDGDDLLRAASGGDHGYGGNGNDTIEGDEGADVLRGNDGRDLVSGDGGADLLFGGRGADSVYGGSGTDTLYGGAQDDLLNGGFSNDTVVGEAGRDVVRGHDGHDLVRGGAGEDTLYGGRGADTVYGGEGADTAFGGDQDDLIFGHAEGDVIYGGRGNDTIFGGAGDDTIYAGDGNDVIIGGGGNDVIIGGDGFDVILDAQAGDTIGGVENGLL